MVPHASAVAAAILLVLGTSGSERDALKPCASNQRLEDGAYPEHRYSPLESLENYDMVFHGEVVVPTKPCSLGYCAGLKVLNSISGYRGKRNTIVRVGSDSGETCVPTTFATKGKRWVVYGTRKHTTGGTPFMEVSLGDPTFPATIVPDFDKMDEDYFRLRARLDYAIDKKRNPQKKLR